MAMTTKMKNDILNNWFRNEVYDVADILYLGLSKTAPTAEGGNVTEPTANSYERLAITANTTNWNSAVNGSLDNSIALRFREAEESWTTAAAPITHYAIFDAATGGNVLFYGALAHSQEIPTGSVLEIPENGLKTSILNT